MINGAHRLVAAGALVVAAVAAPLAISLTGAAAQAVAAPCLSSVTSQGDDPVCSGYSNGHPTNIGTPWGIYGPNSSTGGYNNGTFGPLLPNRTWTNGG